MEYRKTIGPPEEATLLIPGKYLMQLLTYSHSEIRLFQVLTCGLDQPERGLRTLRPGYAVPLSRPQPPKKRRGPVTGFRS